MKKNKVEAIPEQVVEAAIVELLAAKDAHRQGALDALASTIAKAVNQFEVEHGEVLSIALAQGADGETTVEVVAGQSGFSS